jgi:hypothetical protein
MTQKKSRRLPALQASLFCDRNRRGMSWDRIPERMRQRVLERLAQLLRESCETPDSDQDNGKEAGGDD